VLQVPEARRSHVDRLGANMLRTSQHDRAFVTLLVQAVLAFRNTVSIGLSG
jgi:hypothetical protein